VQDILIKNIKGLVQVRENIPSPVSGVDMDILPVIEDAYLLIREGRIYGYGNMRDFPETHSGHVIDARGRFVFPSFIDSHTHLIYPASREEEFVLKIRGSSYAEIASRGGGILNSARKLAQASEEQLLDSAIKRLDEIAKTGTGVVEIKSGYGLTLEGELKMLRVARKLKSLTRLLIKTTFLGAHAIPQGMAKAEYIDLLINEMLPAVANEGLADYIDVFCEQGFFSPEDTEKILAAGLKYGIKGRLHANQLSRSGGVQIGVKMKVLSVDHLENIGAEEIDALKGSNVMPTLLPGAAFFLNLPMPPAREMLSAGLPLTLASDYNPGSSPSGNMPLMLSLACIRMRLTPNEAFNASTINAAFALELQKDYGSISKGKVANLFISKPIPSVAYFPYAYGTNLVEQVILNGEVLD
jgi:imidazolonepropionase